MYRQARIRLEEESYVDTFLGRSIMVEFAFDETDPSDYDRVHGKGAFATVVEEMRRYF